MVHKNDTRQNIITAASHLFQMRGYHGTGLNDIVKESGAPKGSLYYHFPQGKEQIALEAIRQIDEKIQQEIQAELDEVDDPILAIQTFLKHLAKKIFEKDTLYFSIGILALENSSMDNPLRKACSEAFNAWKNINEKKLIKGGFDQKHARELSDIVHLMVAGASILSLTNNDGSSLVMVAEKIPLLANNKL